jgi:hypothetical protein
MPGALKNARRKAGQLEWSLIYTRQRGAGLIIYIPGASYLHNSERWVYFPKVLYSPAPGKLSVLTSPNSGYRPLVLTVSGPGA